ncbi:threonine--tRNA ligase, partial [Myxococcota bacterium]|nr:threonine--tRNA ligase [Myxococcota bacterium]
MELSTVRHSLAHVMAAVVTQMYPDTKLAIGPSIDNGFYYDFDFTQEWSGEALKEIEKRMKKFIGRNFPFEHYTLPVDEALEYYTKEENPYKIELIEELKAKGETEIGFYRVGEFVDMCRGPHVEFSKEIPMGFK